MKTKKLRVGILTESDFIPAWGYKMLQEIIALDCAEIVLNVQKSATPTLKRGLLSKITDQPAQALFFLYKKYDERKNKPKPSAFELKPIHEIIQCDKIKVSPQSTRYSDRFLAADLERIKPYEIDVLIRMGFNILRGEILTLPKFGVWSYHHGDNRINRGGPAGTWEVLEKWPETGALLQILTEDLDGGIKLDTCSIQTQKKSLLINRNMIYWKSCRMLPLKLQELHRLGEQSFFEKVKELNLEISAYDGPLYKAPRNIQMVKPIWSQVKYKLKRKFHKLFYFDQWILLFAFSKSDAFSTSFFRFKRILPPKDRIWADPFVFKKDGIYYVFLEELILGKQKKAHLSVMELDKKGNHTVPIKIIEEDWHLSYPFIFQHKDQVYLIPESNDNKSIDLYVANQFPFQWEKRKTLMSNIVASDSTVFYHNSKFWLFTAISPLPGTSTLDELYLYYSDELLSDNWKAHPKNPIVKHARYARPAGAIFSYNGKIIRPSQNNAGHYGAGFNFQEILVLNETDYQELNVESVNPNWASDLISTHTFNHVDGLTLIDALIKRKK